MNGDRLPCVIAGFQDQSDTFKIWPIGDLAQYTTTLRCSAVIPSGDLAMLASSICRSDIERIEIR